MNFMYSPLSGELSLASKHPDAAATIANTPLYATHLDELRTSIGPELELIESRVMGPVKEFQGVLKVIRKTITKRDHKLVDYDRFNNSLSKLRDKKEKSLNDEKNLFKVC
jgi:amphiphysin